MIGSDSQVFTGEAGITLSEVPDSTPLLGIFERFWGNDLYALKNGTTQLKATAPDGTVGTLDITVEFPTTSWVSAINLSAPDGTPSISPLYNNRTAPITWFAQGTTTLGWIGMDTAGMVNFQADFLEKLERSGDGLSASSTFTLQNPPTDIGTAILYASTDDGGATAAVPVTTVNAPGTGLLSFGIRSLDPQVFAEMFTVSFYGTDNQLTCARDVYAMHLGDSPVIVGNIPPGTYKLLFTPGNTSVKPQWWPNAVDISAASAVTFGADTPVENIYFFGLPQPADTTLTLDGTGRAFDTPAAGTGSIALTTGDPGLVWAAAVDVPWITLTSGVSGTGSGAVAYSVAANPYGAMRTGTITIGDQTFTITQAGTGIIPPHVGVWGTQQLIRFNEGYDTAGGVSVPWYAEAARTTLNEDGTGTMVITKNDHNGEVTEETLNFTYTMASNADGSMTVTMAMGDEDYPVRMVTGDDGLMGIVDGTGVQGQEKLMVLYRIDTAKSYGSFDMDGEYYNVGFERNATGVVDPPDGNGSFMAISGVHTFNGNGLYGYYGKANSLTSGGGNVIWDDSGKTNQPYEVGAAGTVTSGGGAFRGWLTGNGLAGGGGGVFLDGANNQAGYFFLKKGDRSYTNADLAGRWALVGFGQDSEADSQRFSASIGTMICDAAGTCGVKMKDRWSDETTQINTDTLALSVAADGSFGTFLSGQSPSHAGVIGNDGNTILLNVSFKSEVPYHREIVIGIRADNIGDLAGGTAFVKGDLDGGGTVDLADAVLALQVAAGISPAGLREDYTISPADVDGDGMVDTPETLYILQHLGGLRQ